MDKNKYGEIDKKEYELKWKKRVMNRGRKTVWKDSKGKDKKKQKNIEKVQRSYDNKRTVENEKQKSENAMMRSKRMKVNA